MCGSVLSAKALRSGEMRAVNTPGKYFMSKIAASAFIAVPSVLAGSIFLTSAHTVRHLDYRLVDEALVIIPVDNPAYADAAADLYLKASGFEVSPDYANVATLKIPEVVPGGGLDNAVDYGVHQLVSSIETEYDGGNGDISAADPLYVFGYSQSSVVAGMAEQQLYTDGIPSPPVCTRRTCIRCPGMAGPITTTASTTPVCSPTTASISV